MQLLQGRRHLFRGIVPFVVLCLVCMAAPDSSRGDDFQSLFQAGMRWYQAGDFTSSFATFQEAVKVNPKAGDALYMLGQMYEKGEGVAASEVEAANYYRQAWKNGSQEAYSRLELLYSEALDQKSAPRSAKPVVPPAPLAPPATPAPPVPAVLPASPPPAESAEARVVIDIPTEALARLKDVQLRSSQEDSYKVVLTCPDNCTDLSSKAEMIAALLGGTVVPEEAGSRSVQPEHYELISLQMEPDNRSVQGVASDIANALDVMVTCKGWCGIIKVVAKSVAEILGELDHDPSPPPPINDAAASVSLDTPKEP